MLITLLKWPPRRGRNATGSRTAPKPFLSDAQWDLIADLFPHPPVSPQGGRPRIEPRPCLEGVLWVLKTGARWEDLPDWYPSPSTCHRRHREWTESGVFLEAWRRLLHKLHGLRQLNLDEAIGDGTFVPAKKGAQASA